MLPELAVPYAGSGILPGLGRARKPSELLGRDQDVACPEHAGDQPYHVGGVLPIWVVAVIIGRWARCAAVTVNALSSAGWLPRQPAGAGGVVVVVGAAGIGKSRLLAEGEKDDAIAVLEAACDAYLTANATRDLARVRSALHALGVRKRRAAIARPGHGWGSLTSGEMAVVEVVAQGLTNRETAAQLYLSADTVNSHLRHAFAKLGIRSRVELARIAANRERTPV